VSVLVAAALPLLHTKAGQRLQQSKIKEAQLNYFQWRLVQAATQESHTSRESKASKRNAGSKHPPSLVGALPQGRENRAILAT
jgi:hypothetical protein